MGAEIDEAEAEAAINGVKEAEAAAMMFVDAEEGVDAAATSIKARSNITANGATVSIAAGAVEE